MMRDKSIVHIVDDDPAMLAAIWLLLSTEGFDVRTYPSAMDFLRRIGLDDAGCLVTEQGFVLSAIALSRETTRP
jgi:FixJ family two-component response regulator